MCSPKYYNWNSTVEEFPETRELMERVTKALRLATDGDKEKEALISVAEDAFGFRNFVRCEEALAKLGIPRT